MDLTEKQQQVLDFINKFIADHGWAPTRKEIAVEFGFRSDNAADEHLKALERKGAIAIGRAVSRGIRVL